jgi:hypothetical protein
MKRWLIVSGIGAVSALVLLQLSQPNAASAPSRFSTPADNPGAQPLPAVQVEQVLVEADLVKVIEPDGRPLAVPVSPRRPAGTSGWTTAAPTQTESVQPVGLHEARTPPPMLERAKRAFLGNGRHRPEPFPRLKDN